MNALRAFPLVLACTFPLAGWAQGAPAPASIPPPRIAASPALVTLEIGSRPVNGSVRLFNLGKDPIDIRASSAHFDLDQNNRLRIIAPTAQSLDQWLVFNPSRFRIEAGKQQVVRFSVRPPVQPAPGEHRAMLFFENEDTDASATQTVKVNFRLGVAIYGMAPPVDARGILHGVTYQARRDEVTLVLDVQSVGNAHVRFEGQVSLWPASRFPGIGDVQIYNLTQANRNVPDEVVATRLPSVPVLAGTRRQVRVGIANPGGAGRYRVAIKGTLGGKPIDRVVSVEVN